MPKLTEPEQLCRVVGMMVATFRMGSLSDESIRLKILMAMRKCLRGQVVREEAFRTIPGFNDELVSAEGIFMVVRAEWNIGENDPYAEERWEKIVGKAISDELQKDR